MCSLPLVHSPSSHQSWGVGRAKAGSPAHDQALPRGLQGPAVGVYHPLHHLVGSSRKLESTRDPGLELRDLEMGCRYSK